MIEDLKNQTIIILRDTIKAIKDKEPEKISKLSNFTIHTASIKQNKESITIAVLIYSLSKIYQREYSKKLQGWDKFNKEILKELDKALRQIANEDHSSYEKTLKRIFNKIKKLDWKIKNYIQRVLQKARINKASRLYEHGISIGRTAELLGISKYDLMEYTGKTFIADSPENQTINIEKRLETTRRLFK